MNGDIMSYRICLDFGHGGSEPGAVSKKYGYKEKDIVLKIGKLVAGYLNSAIKDNNSFILSGVDAKANTGVASVILTRDCDKDICLAERCKIANKEKADVFVSIHCNSCYSDSPNGIETWYYDSPKSSSKKLASCIQKALMDSVSSFTLGADQQPIKSRGIKGSTVYYTLRHTVMPSVVVECGFMSSPIEVSLMNNDSTYRDALARGIALGILNFFKKV